MSKTVAVYLDGIGGMNKSDFSTWATARNFPSLHMVRRMQRTADGKALTVNEAPEYFDIPIQLSLSDNMAGDIHDHFINKKRSHQGSGHCRCCGPQRQNAKPLTQVTLTNVIVQDLSLDTEETSGEYVAGFVLDFQTIQTQYANGAQKKDITWEKGVRQH